MMFQIIKTTLHLQPSHPLQFKHITTWFSNICPKYYNKSGFHQQLFNNSQTIYILCFSLLMLAYFYTKQLRYQYFPVRYQGLRLT